LALVLSSCSVSANVVGIVGKSDDMFTGKATGYPDRTGTIEMESPVSNRRCIGEFRYTGERTGRGTLTCSDGQTANIQFIALSSTSGHGMGQTDRGEPIRFTYGLTAQESRPYLR
jgi:hypothetical protein